MITSLTAGCDGPPPLSSGYHCSGCTLVYSAADPTVNVCVAAPCLYRSPSCTGFQPNTPLHPAHRSYCALPSYSPIWISRPGSCAFTTFVPFTLTSTMLPPHAVSRPMRKVSVAVAFCRKSVRPCWYVVVTKAGGGGGAEGALEQAAATTSKIVETLPAP